MESQMHLYLISCSIDSRRQYIQSYAAKPAKPAQLNKGRSGVAYSLKVHIKVPLNGRHVNLPLHDHALHGLSILKASLYYNIDKLYCNNVPKNCVNCKLHI